MMMYILSVALKEVEEASDYYEQQRAGLGHEFFLAYEEAVKQILAFPGAWSKVEANCRRRRFKKFPYGVVYRVHEDSIYVVAVMHLRRKPGYWKRRLKGIE